MTNTTTVSITSPSAASPEAARVEDSQQHSASKRQKTWGEKIFNWRTYGGIALLGNEAASLAITQSVEPGKPLHRYYNKFATMFSDLKRIEKTNGGPALHEYIIGSERLVEGKPLAPRLPFVLVATLGGMLMVPFVKYAEDHKGSIVRRLDRKHYGALTDSDPKLVEAHKDMDEAPKQTWSSLWKGRAITVAAAVGVDAAMGTYDAPSTKLFKNETYQKFGSMQRIANETANAFVGRVNKVRGLFNKAELAPAAAEGTKYWVKQGTWLMVLSSTLTVLFFASSKLFAKRQEQKIERKQEMRTHTGNGSYGDATPEALESPSPEVVEEKSVTEKPTPQVKSISREDTVASVPQLSQGA